ncbi:class D sortase [Bacillus sp. FJAT-45037]|uniref:class D sortase n=1 Tax=Bacillus sp. FJAT-45037 TaxID=2011007 RepID=UPI0018E22FD7|nr:class D sortase [Bacillus sp. FJAT-45037]
MNKRIVITCLSLVLLAGGIWFTTTNAYNFVKGYWLYKSSQEVVVSKPAEEISKEQELDLEVEQEESYSHVQYPLRPEIGDSMGELVIPTLNATLPIYHGTHEDELEKGVGHFEGSVLPGEANNSVLSGHRDTVFRKLGEVEKGDLLIVRTGAGEFTYKVRRTRVVDKEDRTVIVPKPRAMLTVSTCYPFDFIGAAPERYVLQADLIDTKTAVAH